MDNANKDLELAKEIFIDGNHSLVIVKDGTLLLKSDETGIMPLFNACEKLKITDASIADKVVGKAASLIFAYAKIKNVFTPLISQPSLDFLISSGIYPNYLKIVPNIMNKTKSDLCPWEKRMADFSNPELAYKLIKGLVSS